MNLTFLVPAFLAGLLAIGIPVLVHLRQREQKDPVRFPSLMFLRMVPHRTVERRRITQPWLLLLRALAVTALVAAFSRPFWRDEDQAPAAVAKTRALIVVIDRSLSMGYRGVFGRAADSAAAALSRLRPGDLAAVVASDESAEVVAPLDGDLAGVRSRMATVAPTGRAGRMAPALRTAADIATRARGRAVEIVLISDLQRNALQGLEAVERVAGATLRIVSVAERNPENARIHDVDVDRRADGRRTTLAVGARIALKGDSARAITANLIVNNRPVASATARLAPNTTASLRFEPVVIAEGDALASVALEPDALTADDTLRFSVASASGIPVVLQLPGGGTGDESLYLERALAISRAPALDVIIRRGVPATDRDLDRAAVVVLVDVTPTAGTIAKLDQFVSKGGGLVVIAGSRSGGSSARPSWWPASVGRVIDRTTDRGGRLGQIDPDHAAFEPFKDALATDFGAARFFRYRELVPDSAAAVLARFDDGTPAIVEGALGAGRIVMLGTATNTLWADFPLQPVFLPLIQRIVGYVGQLQDPKRWYPAGEVVPLPAVTGALTLRVPGEEGRAKPIDSKASTLSLVDPGVYEIGSVTATAPIARFAVNPRASESDLAAADPKEVWAQLKAPTDSTSAPNVAPLSGAEQERTQSWWTLLLALALLLLAAESWYTGRLGRVTVTGGTR
jgi:hypothetical protein